MVMINLQKPPVLVLATNPWLSMPQVVNKAKVNVKKFWYFRNPPPWSKYRNYRKGASPRQQEVWDRFAEASRRAAEETRDLPKYERLAKRIELIRQYMKGRTIAPAPRPAGGYLPPI